MKKQTMKWSFGQIWNESLVNRKERQMRPRNRIWASEVGGSMIDRYLKMTGVKPTNPPNMRSLRKFEAGNIWEWIVGLVLKRAGIFIGEQGWVEYRYPGLLPVTGKIDFLAGGKPDWEKASAELNGLPECISRATQDIITHFKNKFPFGMDELILEVKSCSSFMFEHYERSGFASKNHSFQAFHYLKAKNMREAHIVYISKDDARMLEIGVFNPSPLEEEYRKDIEMMTGYIKRNEQPPKEKEIVFDKDFGRFSKNWKVAYSSYLTKIYGYKNQKEFDDKYVSQVSRWNRVLKRVVDKKNMTKKNLEVIKEIEKEYPDFEDKVKQMKMFKEKK